MGDDLRDNPRAGLVLQDAAGDLSGGSITGSRFGVVLVGSATLDAQGVSYQSTDRDQRICEMECLP